tara:strand:+ start:627 stop:1121 length:495 start_codon:yes stop_codon:yes gene_type:complete
MSLKKTINSVAKNLKTAFTNVVEPVGKFAKKVLTLDGFLADDIPSLVAGYSTLKELQGSKDYQNADPMLQQAMLNNFLSKEKPRAIEMAKAQTIPLDDTPTRLAPLQTVNASTVTDLVKQNVLTKGETLTENWKKQREFIQFAEAFNVSPDIGKSDESQPNIKL